jgi:hypothetical protein
VDPRTGRELAPPAADPDATVLGLVPPGEAPPRPVTAEVIPPRDFRHSQEVTAAWDEPDPGRRPNSLRRLLATPGRFPLAVVLGAVVVVLVAGAVAAGLRASVAGGTPTSAPREIAGEPLASPIDDAAGPASAVPVADGEIGAAGEPETADVETAGAQAAAALADGRLEQARALYSRLAAAEPHNRAWSLALEILSGPGAAR